MAFVARLPLVCNKASSGKLLWSLWPSIQKSTSIDQIDSFTNELIDKKAIKWTRKREAILQDANIPQERVYKRFDHVARSLSKDLDAIRQPDLCIDVRLLAQLQLDNVVLGILEEENSNHFNTVLRQCLLYTILPSSDVLIRCLEYLASIAELQLLQELSEVCEEANEAFFKNNANLLPFKSLALWKSGNVEQALSAIEDGYRLGNKNRMPLREAFRTIANEAIGAKSEAALVIIKNTAESVHKHFHETFLIACVWKSTFTSQWFSDQQIATELFENHQALREMVERRASSVCNILLSQHDVDATHRLIQLFLKYKFKEACSSCLKILFNYQYWRRDLRACSEIMQFCLDIDLALPEIETQKLLNLLLNRRPILSNAVAKTECNKFQYKF